MKRFQFRLESLLELRRYYEHEEEKKLAAATGRCVALRHGIEERHESQRTALAGRGTDLGVFMAVERYIARLDSEIRRMETELEAAERAREKAQAEYLEARKKSRVLEILREKRAEEHRKEWFRQEGAELDEIGTTNAVRALHAAQGGTHGE